MAGGRTATRHALAASLTPPACDSRCWRRLAAPTPSPRSSAFAGAATGPFAHRSSSSFPLAEAPPAAPEGEAPAEAPAEGEAPPPPPKKKPKFFVHWNRRKARFYDYNWDYGDNYYSSMVKYMDTRSGGEYPGACPDQTLTFYSFSFKLPFASSHVALLQISQNPQNCPQPPDPSQFTRTSRSPADRPRRMAFAERGIRSNVQRRAIPDTRTASLLDDVRKSIKNFEISQKAYMKSY